MRVLEFRVLEVKRLIIIWLTLALGERSNLAAAY